MPELWSRFSYGTLADVNKALTANKVVGRLLATLKDSNPECFVEMLVGGLKALAWADLSNTTPYPVGSILYHAAPTPPTRFLVADGSLQSRATYNKLFAVIGTRYGAGDGSSTFQLPDLRTSFARGYHPSRDDFGVPRKGSALAAEIVQKLNSDNTTNAGLWLHLEETEAGTTTKLSTYNQSHLTRIATDGSTLQPVSVSDTLERTLHNLIPPYLPLLPCICYK